MQGTKNEAAAGRVLDLDAQLAARMLEPVPVRLGGRVYHVRTDLTSEQANQYLVAARARRDVEAFAILIGKKDATLLNSTLEALPKQHSDAAVRAMMLASVVLADFAPATQFELSLDVPTASGDDAEGGSSAS